MIRHSIFFCILLLTITSINAQNEGYTFEHIVDLKTTSVKSQHASGTCWAFSGLSFFESELLRMNKGELDLSEMFLVRWAYHQKAIDYVRYQGNISFSGGGESNDVTDMMRTYGIVPENIYKGLNYGTENHVHGELDAVLLGIVEAVVKNENKKLTPVWTNAFDAVMDTYLGEIPEKFTYNEKEYTPISFRDELGINPDNYIEIGSYSHHPFYSEFVFELPDNWSNGKIYNVPIDEFIEICDYALNNGFSLLWGSDVSEDGFSHSDGIAIIPEKDFAEMSDAEILKWEKMSQNQKNGELYNFDAPSTEKDISQELRQKDFDNLLTTDDHGMHITGIAKDQNGNKYYIVKNSWGDSNKYGGNFYASEAFVKAKSMSIMLHKDAVPDAIAKKLNLKKQN